MRRLLHRLLGRARPAPLDGAPRRDRRHIFPAPDPNAAIPPDRSAIDAALRLNDGARVGDEVMAAISAQMRHRRAITGTLGGPANPVATNLHVRKSSLPDWWNENGNLCLCTPETQHFEIGMGFLARPSAGSIVVVGSRSGLTKILTTGGPALVVVGDDVSLMGSSLATSGASTILIGEKTSATWMANVSAFNGGIVVVGRDNMWAPGVTFMTDDSHRIYDMESGRRINRYAGRIVLDEHVWLGLQVGIAGDCLIGTGGVVGQGSYVRDVALPPNAISVGRVAKPVRTGIGWARDDRPE
jgi:acetyltransferase-like isoleucine patch superfamily enzyme